MTTPSGPPPHDPLPERAPNVTAAVVLLAALLGFVVSSASTAWRGLPEPAYHDEHSYLLAADTFAQGRMSTPPHPLWPHFEMLHVLSQPMRASKYPPGQGLLLALGQVAGHPIVGAWLGIAAFAGATCWLLLGWLGPRWAVAGGVLVAVQYGWEGYWSQSYWGGALAAAAGALVFGATGRLARDRIGRRALAWAAVLGCGLAILANTRPYEGVVLGLCCGVGLALRRTSPGGTTGGLSPGPTLRVLALGCAPILAACGLWMAVYNHAVTGRALTLPYQAYSAESSSVPQFVWQPMPRLPDYRHTIHEIYWRSMAGRFEALQSPSYLAAVDLDRLLESWRFFVGWSLLPMVIAAAWSRHRFGVRLAFACGVATAIALAGSQSFHEHYVAPLAGALILVVAAGAEAVWKALCERLGHRRATAVIAVWFAVAMAEMVVRPDPYLPGAAEHVTPSLRPALAEQLEQIPGGHVILVRHQVEASIHDEWVANPAEIDAQRVIWAHDMGHRENEDLLAYYPDRHIWWLVVGADPARADLRPLRPPVGSATTSH